MWLMSGKNKINEEENLPRRIYEQNLSTPY